MMIEAYCTLEEIRKFLIESTCKSFIPKKFLRDSSVFPERRIRDALIYIEAESKRELEQIGEIVFVEARNIMGIIYNSKSGKSKLKWRQIYKDIGKLTGEASSNTLVNLFTAGIRKIEPVKEESKQIR